MDPWKLIEFNYPSVATHKDLQAKAAEVNWYLRNYVGCDRPTADSLNWRFSSTARPGTIHLPLLPLAVGRRTNLWYGLGLKWGGMLFVIKKMAGEAVLFSHDDRHASFALTIDGWAAGAGLGGGVGTVAVIATGLEDPAQLHGQNLEDDLQFELNIALGKKWDKLFKSAKKVPALEKLVRTGSQIAGQKLRPMVESIKKGKFSGAAWKEAVRTASKLTPEEYERMWDAAQSALDVAEIDHATEQPKVAIIDLPLLDLVPVPTSLELSFHWGFAELSVTRMGMGNPVSPAPGSPSTR
jgi:hypothetical protein